MYGSYGKKRLIYNRATVGLNILAKSHLNQYYQFHDSNVQVGETGKVVGIDHIDELINWSKDNVRKDNAALLDSGRIKFVIGDGRKGFPADAPYNAIHVGAAAPTLPQEVII